MFGAELCWQGSGWTYRLTPQGHRWRFTATFDAKTDLRSDFGLVPGGVYVAIAKLLGKATR